MKRLPKLIYLLLAFVLIPALAVAAPANNNANKLDKAPENPTFYKDVLPVLQGNCQVCHRPDGVNLGGMVAPMSFTTYESTRPWARSIAKQVEAKTMPPWHASPAQHGVFVNERTMTDPEIETLVRWAKSGAPAGDQADAPAAIEWPENDGWSIGKPDLVIDMGLDYEVADDIEDHYITFETTITKEQLPEPRWVKAVEFRPGSSVVHHIIAPPLGGIAPGNDPDYYDDGFATLLKPDTKIRWQMHYHKEAGPGTAVMDRSMAAIRFYPKDFKPKHVVLTDPLATADFLIPPGEANYSHKTSMTFDFDALLLGLLPHMHVRGKAAHYLAKYPDGTEEVLLEVPAYDFNWQTQYKYPAPGKKVPKGTTIELTMTWDNSADNPNNPDPTVPVKFGQPTTDEMMFGFVNYAHAEPYFQPSADEGWFGDRSARIKKMIERRFNVDWDSLSEEEQGELMQRLRREREAASGESVGSP